MKKLVAASAALIAAVAVAGCSAEGDDEEGSTASTSTESQTTETTGPDAFSGNAVRLASELEPHIGKQPPKALDSFARFSCDLVEKGGSLADAASNVDLMFGETWNYPDEGVVLAASFNEYCPELLPAQTPSSIAWTPPVEPKLGSNDLQKLAEDVRPVAGEVSLGRLDGIATAVCSALDGGLSVRQVGDETASALSSIEGAGWMSDTSARYIAMMSVVNFCPRHMP